jgi:hypothetical protein
VRREVLTGVLVDRLRDNYSFSDERGMTLGSYGVLILVRKPHVLRKSFVQSFPTRLGRYLLCASLTLKDGSGENGTRVVVGTAHLESIAGNSGPRSEQLEISFPYIRHLATREKASCYVFTGDFNFCSTNQEENSAIPRDFVDVWPVVTPGEDPGWTEGNSDPFSFCKRFPMVPFVCVLTPIFFVTKDSDVNRMMFLEKRRKKQVRFDRILVSDTGGYAPKSARLVGTEIIQDAPEERDQLWISDHFGVVTDFTIRQRQP